MMKTQPLLPSFNSMHEEKVLHFNILTIILLVLMDYNSHGLVKY